MKNKLRSLQIIIMTFSLLRCHYSLMSNSNPNSLQMIMRHKKNLLFFKRFKTDSLIIRNQKLVKRKKEFLDLDMQLDMGLMV